MEREEGLIRPIKRKNDPDLLPDVVMVMIPDMLNYAIKNLSQDRYDKYNQYFYNLYTINRKNDIPCCLAGPFLGAPQAVMGMEQLITLGAQRIWVLGYCGSLNPDLRIGDVLIPLEAISEEGTSAHYPTGESQLSSDHGLNMVLEEQVSKYGLKGVKGMVWTTDAPYRETVSKVLEFQKRGVWAVDMEYSALLTLARFRRVRLAAIFVVSDELFDLKWRPGFSSPRLKESSKKAMELLLAITGLPERP